MVKWEMVRLGDVCTLITKGTTPTTLGYVFEDQGVCFVKVESITENGTFIKEKFQYISDECNQKLKRSQLKENDVLFSIAGALGRTAIVTKDILPANTNQALAIIRLDCKELDLHFVVRALNSNNIYEQFQKQKQGVAQLNLSLKNISDLLIPLPPLDEQKRIAKSLDLASEIVKGYKKKLAEMDKLMQSVFYEMFGDPVTNEKEWEIQPLQSVCDVRDGTHDSPTYVRDGYPLVTSKNVKQGYIDFSTANLISHEDILKINLRSKVDKGDIIMPMIGTIGNPVIVNVNQEFAVKNVAIIKFAGSSMCNIFIKTLLSSSFFENAIQKANRGGTQKFIALGDIRKLPIPIPPLDTQTRFASIVTEIEAQKAQIQQALTEAENLFNSLMQEYFE